MKTTVVCGLLGTGKTTFIQQAVKNASERTVVLVNDFGKAGIDGEIFSADGIESIELPSGCVCCTLKFDLITTLRNIMKKFNPAHLLIEPSGVASPSGVLEALEIVDISPVMVVGIVDAAEFADLYETQMYGRFFEEQIALSDIILVNKIDLASEEQIQRAVATVSAVNPGALVLTTVKAALAAPLPDRARAHAAPKGHGSYFNFDSLSVSLARSIGFAEVEAFFRDMAQGAFGEVVRAKALAQTDRGPYRFDFTFGKVDVAPFDKEVAAGRLVIIGSNLKKEALALGSGQEF